MNRANLGTTALAGMALFFSACAGNRMASCTNNGEMNDLDCKNAKAMAAEISRTTATQRPPMSMEKSPPLLLDAFKAMEGTKQSTEIYRSKDSTINRIIQEESGSLTRETEEKRGNLLIIDYVNNEKTLRVRQYTKNGLLHSPGIADNGDPLPAMIVYDKDENVMREDYYNNGRYEMSRFSPTPAGEPTINSSSIWAPNP